MPKFQVEMSDGRKFVVEADSQPTEAEVLAQLGGGGRTAPVSATPTADAFNKAVGLNSAEPDNYAAGFGRSLEDTGLRTVKGIVKGGASALNPINWMRGPLELGQDLIVNGGKNTSAMLDAVASGDPDAGGQVIGGLLAGKVASNVLPRVVRGISKASPEATDLLKAGARFIPRGEKAAAAFEDLKTARAAKTAEQLRGDLGVDRYMPNQSAPTHTEFAEPALPLRGPIAPKGANLVTSPSNPWQALLDELASTDTANDPADAVGGAAKPIPSNVGPFDTRIANAEPRLIKQGYEASLPDKTGTSVIRMKPPQIDMLLEELKKRGLTW